MPIPPIGIAARAYRHINRYRQILTVLFKYGFGELVDQLRVGQYLELGLKLISRERHVHAERMTIAERVRHALEELGPTFVKMGQVLSTRPDLVPVEFALEFSHLRQEVPPFAFEQVREIIEHDLRHPLEEIFSHFEPHSLAAASIGQVHRATLRSGERVVVKVQRPNIRAVVEVDMEILDHLAELAERHIEETRAYFPRRIVREFARVISRELDFRAEAAYLERFQRQFADDEHIRVPTVFRNYTTRRVLTMEYLDVISVGDRAAVVAAGLDPAVLAARGTDLTLKQIFVHGFFHADPHPGNCFALPGNVVCFLDFGMMGRLDRDARESFADLIYAVAQRDEHAATHALLRITRYDLEDEPDLHQLSKDVAEFIDLNIPISLGDLDFSRLIHELMDLVRRHRLEIPSDFVMMMKAAATAEQLVRELDPSINMIEAAKPFVRRLKLERLRPGRVVRDLLETGGDFANAARELPSGIRDLVRLSKRGRLKIAFEHRGLESLVDTHDRVASRLSFAIVVAALIVGSSLIIHSKLPPTWYEIPIIGLVGFLVAGVLGFFLLISVLRRGRH